MTRFFLAVVYILFLRFARPYETFATNLTVKYLVVSETKFEIPKLISTSIDLILQYNLKTLCLFLLFSFCCERANYCDRQLFFLSYLFKC